MLHLLFILSLGSGLCAAVEQVAGLPADKREQVLKGYSTQLKKKVTGLMLGGSHLFCQSVLEQETGAALISRYLIFI